LAQAVVGVVEGGVVVEGEIEGEVVAVGDEAVLKVDPIPFWNLIDIQASSLQKARIMSW
jgi:hypothetical protein